MEVIKEIEGQKHTNSPILSPEVKTSNPFILHGSAPGLGGGGRKGGTNTAIPHMVAREYRNTASKFSQIPKPQLQMGKS